MSKPLQNKTLLDGNIITIDPSGEHLAYAVVHMDQVNSTAKYIDVGIIWTHTSWTKGHRFDYMQKCLKHLVLEYKPVGIWSEAYFVNPKMRTGMSIIPTINHIIQMVMYQLDNETTFGEISPTSWRGGLQIKPDYINGKRDYKGPTKVAVEKLLGKPFPSEVLSNITGKLRSLPTDIPDALAISIYVIKEHGIKVLDFDNNLVYNKQSSTFKEYI